MPAFRGPDGKVVYVPEDEADRYRAGGDYQEVGRAEAGAAQNKIAPTDNGVLGSIGATVSAGLSGATLGASDWLLKGVLDKGQFEQLAQDRADNPILAGAAQTAGMMLPALVSGGAATPAGALGRLAAEGIETGRATGGALGVAQQLGAAGAEGAIANAGIYLSDVALGDRNLTAEGMNGALGTGLLFGAAGVPVAHGIEAGTIAARRMFARYAEGGAEAATAASSAWTEKAQRHLEAFDQAAELAKAKLAETQTAREAANLQRLRASAEMADARAFTPPSEFPGAPEPAGTASEVAGTVVPAEPPEVTGARALRDRAKTMAGEPITPEEVAALEQQIGTRLYSSRGAAQPAASAAPQPNALEQLAQQPGVTTKGPATLVRERGIIGPPVTADEAELGARLGEYQAARRSFDELHAQVDPTFAAAMGKIDAGRPALDRMLAGADQSDLDTLLGTMHGRAPGNPQLEAAMRRLVDTPDVVGAGGIPVGEFGAPGARGFKSQDELARLASGTDADAAAREVRDLTAGRAARSEEGTAVLAKGTRPRSIGEVAADQSPVPIEQPSTTAGKRPASARSGAAPVEQRSAPDAGRIPGTTADRIEVKKVGNWRDRKMEVVEYHDGVAGEPRTVSQDEAYELLQRSTPPGFRAHQLDARADFTVAAGIPKSPSEIVDNAIYVVKPSELAERGILGNKIRPDDLKRGAEGLADSSVKLPTVEIDMAPNGEMWVMDGNHRVQNAATTDRPMAVRFRRVAGTRAEERAAGRASSIGGDPDIDISERIRDALPKPAAPSTSEALAGQPIAEAHGFKVAAGETVRPGVPKFSEVAEGGTVRTIRPSELDGPRFHLTESASAADIEGVRDGWKAGKEHDPVTIEADPEGHYAVSGGSPQLLAAAAEGDRPVIARFRPTEESFEREPELYSPLYRALGRDTHVPYRESDAALAEIRTGNPKLADEIDNFFDAKRRTIYKQRQCAHGMCDALDPEFRAFAKSDLSMHRFDMHSDEGFAEIKRLYHMTNAEVADIRAEMRHRIKDLEVPTSDMYHQVSVTPDGIVIDWTANQLHDLPVPYVFRLRPASAPATDTLTGQLRGMQTKLGAGEELVAMGEPAREAYRAAKAERTAAAAEHFRGKGLAARAERAARYGLGDPAAPWNEGVPMARAVEAHDAPDPAFFAKLTAPKTRDAYVAANIGRAMREEGSHAAGLARLEREWAERSGHPFEIKRLEMAHDEALERAATAADPVERAAAAQEAQAIERQITQVGARPGAVEDIAALAPAVTRIEKAAAALTEALGDAAPAAAKEHAAAFRAAEDEASRKTVARIGQAADDAATGRAAAQNRDPLAPPARAAEDLLLGPSQKQQRIAAAQKAQREAGAAYAKARVAEAEAQIGAKQAAGAAADARAKLGPPPESPGAARRGPGVAGGAVHAAHVAGYAAELGSDLGIPGIPHPHDIPVIGPLLSAYLKYRALRAAAGRFMGRVPATAETRAAALAARTRDGIARAVDRSLGLIERNANTVRAALTVGTLNATDALSKRLVDDGGPDAPAKASVSEQAAVRMREVAAVIANPSLVQASIRAQGRALTDPDLIDALSAHLLAMFQRLSDVAPKGPPPNPFTGKQWAPSPAEAIRFGQQVAIARDPLVAFQMLEAGTLTPTGADTLRACYALLFRDGQARVVQRANDLKHPVDYSQLIRLGRLFDLTLHPSQDPEHAAVLAGAHTPATKPAPAAAGSPPTPSIAGPTTLSNLYQPSGERAQR